MKFLLPPSTKNWLSLAGVIIVLTSLFMIAFLFIVTAVLKAQAVYLGLVMYILLPAIIILGLIFIPIGMLREVRRERREGVHPAAGWPKIDLEEPRYRHAFFIFVVGTSIFVLLSAVGSYEAFQYTESTEFCGTLCHRVMNPEYTAHRHSPHAQVACVACHVGPGADWYARSKLSGLYQVYATLADVFPRPIPTPIKNLRPARAVCEQCHWPQKFYGQKFVLRTHYLSDPGNTPWDIGLNLKLGPSQPALGLVEGIHWHVNRQVRIDYLAADAGRQQLPWVRYTNLQTGEVKVFRDKNRSAAGGSPSAGVLRTMDCMDCHNRPAHLYRVPSRFIDEAMTAGRIPATLPGIKRLAVQLCMHPYQTPEQAREAIRAGITRFYQLSYPQLYAQQRPLVEKGVAGVQEEFAQNIFPSMRVAWSAYPDNIGHLYFSGCFRCHDGSHQTDRGETISRDCTLCHDIGIQGPRGKEMEAARFGKSLSFRHPVDIGNAWQETPCTDCHTGGGS